MGDARTQRLKPHCGGISIRACASSQLTPSPPSPVLADLLQSIGTPGKDEGELGDVVRAEVGMRNGFGRVGDAPKRVRQQLALTAWGGGGVALDAKNGKITDCSARGSGFDRTLDSVWPYHEFFHDSPQPLKLGSMPHQYHGTS